MLTALAGGASVQGSTAPQAPARNQLIRKKGGKRFVYHILITWLILASTESKEHESLRFSATAVEEKKGGGGYKRI